MEILKNYILNNVHYTWMLIGIILILCEVLTTPGIGILCAGLGSITIGMMILFGLVMDNDYILQFSWFFACTVGWALILWKPLLKLRYSKQQYYNIIGERAIVYKHDLIQGKSGEVKWSGTVMKALIAENSESSSISAGQEVIIKNLKGNILLVDILKL